PCTADPDLFFSEDDDGITRAKRLCSLCPAQAACLDLALASGIEWGVWGGELFERGRIVTPGRTGAPSVSLVCARGHRRSTGNTRETRDGRIRCLDCERARSRRNRTQARAESKTEGRAA